jgi:hypothetical protein
MFLDEKKKAASTLQNIANSVLKNKVIPVETSNGIMMGDYLVQFKNNEYVIKLKNTVYYKTFSKSSAIAICYIMNTSKDKFTVSKILKADHDMFFSHNDLYFIQNAVDGAKKRNDLVKCEILENKLTVTYEKYERANQNLKKYINSII